MAASERPLPSDQRVPVDLPATQPDAAAPRLRLLENEGRVPRSTPALRAWILLFGVLSFSGGHGVFLFTALTRLAKVPGRSELGGPLELAVLGWFVAAAPLALLCVALRARFVRLGPGAAWSLAASAAVIAATAFVLYLRAVALA
jgi:hypothetical protein